MSGALAALWLAAGLLAAPALPLRAEQPAADWSQAQKLDFLERICSGLEREARCQSMGKVYSDLSLDWMVFEACSFSGEKETIMACFDRAAHLAGELTGDPRFEESYAYCHRFPGDDTVDLVVRCYREGFKYSQRFIEDKYRYLDEQ